jgi:hypothetical protein
MSGIFDRVLTLNLVANTAIFYLAASAVFAAFDSTALTATDFDSHSPFVFNATFS